MRKEFSATSYLDDEAQGLLQDVTDLYNKFADSPITPTRMYDNIFGMGNDEIKKRLSFLKSNFTANLSPEIAP